MDPPFWCITFHRDATAAELDSVLDEVVRWTDPPGPNSRMATVVSAEAVDAARAARPRDRMDLIFSFGKLLSEGT